MRGAEKHDYLWATDSWWYVVHSQEKIEVVGGGLNGNTMPPLAVAHNKGFEQRFAPDCEWDANQPMMIRLMLMLSTIQF